MVTLTKAIRLSFDLCVQVMVSVVSEKCRIDTELLPSLFLRCTTDPLRREKYPAVTHLKFLTKENSEQVTSRTSRALPNRGYRIIRTGLDVCFRFCCVRQTRPAA